VITQQARAWLIDLACRKVKELGYPHEVWTTRLLAQHARQHGPAAGHACLADLSQGTVCKILDLERRDSPRRHLFNCTHARTVKYRWFVGDVEGMDVRVDPIRAWSHHK
jgi:hypothetical protein